MDATHFLGFIGIVVAGGIMMAFVLELLNTEPHGTADARRMEAESAVQAASSLPAFFAKPQESDYPPATPGFDDALIALLEEHVRAERAVVTGFVHFPSLDSLYRQTGSSLTLH